MLSQVGRNTTSGIFARADRGLGCGILLCFARVTDVWFVGNAFKKLAASGMT